VETSQQHRSSFVDGDRSIRGATDVCLDDVVWAFLNGFDVVRSYWYFHMRWILFEALMRDGILRATETSAVVLVV
jgi:hypothetical protein